MKNIKTAPFFLPRDWFLCLWLPVIGIIGAAIEILFFRNLLEGLEPSKLRFVYNLVFLNATHLIFPFVLLSTVPEFRQLLASKMRGKHSTRNRLILFSILSLILLMLVIEKGWIFSFAQKNTKSIFFWVWILLPTIHGLRQSGGLGILYSRAIYTNVSTEDQRELTKFTQKERKILLFLYISTLVALVVQGIQELEFHIPSLLIPILFTIPAVCAFCLFFEVKKARAFDGTDKLQFSARMLFWPMAGYSWVAKLMIGIVHGHEYIALIHKMMFRSHPNVYCRLLRVASAYLAFILFYNIIELMSANTGEQVEKFLSFYPPLLLITLLIPILSISHYLVDGLIYRSGDDDVSKNILPLIQGPIKQSDPRF